MERDGAAIRDLLLAHGAGGADIYGIPRDGDPCRGLMFNHVEGAAFDLIVEVARRSDLVVMPIGCPVCVVSQSQIAHLPPELRDHGVEVVRSGPELADVIARS